MPSSAALAEVARRHGIDPGRVAAAPRQGAANRVYLLGDRLVLRVARPEAADDLRKEAEVIPYAVRAGVRTPEVVAFDEADGLFATPYMVLRRAEGVPFGLPHDPAEARWRGAYRELGRELRILHDGSGPVPQLPVAGPADPRADVERLVRSGHLGGDAADWLIGWFERLEARGGTAAQVRLLHGDAAPQNLLVDPGSGHLTAVLDWGDAAAADPATEFAKLPLRALAPVLDGYGIGGDETWAARILRHHLHWAVGRIAAPPDRESTHWSAQPGNRLLEIMRSFNEDPPNPWRSLR